MILWLVTVAAVIQLTRGHARGAGLAAILAVHWAWALVVLAAGAWLLHHLAHRTDVRDIRGGLIAFALALGLIGLLCLPLPLSLAGGVLFIAGAVFALLSWNSASAAAHEQ